MESDKRQDEICCRRDPLLGLVASVYITSVVGSVSAALGGLIIGIVVAGLEGAYAGVVIAVAVVNSVLLLDCRMRDRIVGGLLIGSATATAGLTLGSNVGVWAGALFGILMLPLSVDRREGDLSVGYPSVFRAVLRGAIGATAGAAGLIVLSGFLGMEL